MSDQFWLTKSQFKRIEPFFPRSRGVPRVDDRLWSAGFVRWSRMGIFANLAANSEAPDRFMIDSTHLNAHRTAASLLKREIHPVASAAQKAV